MRRYSCVSDYELVWLQRALRHSPALDLSGICAEVRTRMMLRSCGVFLVPCVE